jgi:hypothetical protein
MGEDDIIHLFGGEDLKAIRDDFANRAVGRFRSFISLDMSLVSSAWHSPPSDSGLKCLADDSTEPGSPQCYHQSNL